MKDAVSNVKALDDYILEAFFTNGDILQYDCKMLIRRFPAFHAMVQTPEIFRHAYACQLWRMQHCLK